MIWIIRILILMAGPLAAYYFFGNSFLHITIGILGSIILFLLSFFFKKNKTGKSNKENFIIALDKSTLIDGRIYDLLKSDIFMFRKVVISKQTIKELKTESALEDIAVKNRAKRASFITDKLQKLNNIELTISSKFSNVKDEYLRTIELAKDFNAKIITADFNMYKMAVVNKTPVLNLNFLEKILAHVFLPGEKMTIFLQKEGSQSNQGVGFLNDGTMVVAENGKKFIGKKVDLTVNSIIQTSSSKMLFGKVDESQFSNTNKHKSGKHQ